MPTSVSGGVSTPALGPVALGGGSPPTERPGPYTRTPVSHDIGTPKRRPSPSLPVSEPLKREEKSPNRWGICDPGVISSVEAQAEARHQAILAHHAGEKHRNFEAFREMQMELALYRMQTQSVEAQAQLEHQAMLSQARSSEAQEVYQTCVGRESSALLQLENAVRQKNLAWEERVENTEKKLQAELREHECHNAEGLQARARSQTEIRQLQERFEHDLRAAASEHSAAVSGVQTLANRHIEELQSHGSQALSVRRSQTRDANYINAR